nr:activating signal cointegrator 1 complex subunit 2-like isoform X1 [Nerophis lumbriciformis]
MDGWMDLRTEQADRTRDIKGGGAMACTKVPLDEQQVTQTHVEGKHRLLAALHPDRKQERLFVPYKPLLDGSSPAEVEEFLERAKFLVEDLDWLLALPHDRFWCQVVFDQSLHKCLDSYLLQAPRGLDLAAPPSSPAATEMQRSLHRAVFLTFLRMATHKESKENFITPSVFGEILYENFLFDVPKMMDLCVLFGRGNSQLLHKMIDNIFTQQPSYYTDLEQTVPTVLQVFDTIMDRCGLPCDTATQPMKLNAHKQPTAISMTQQDFVDIVLYLCDSTSTLHAFFTIFPAACSTFHSHGFLCRLTVFYETVVSDLEKALRNRNFQDESLQEEVWRRLSHSCRKMLEMSHLLLHHTCLTPILEGAENSSTLAEELLQHFTSFLSEKRFLTDYDQLFPMADQVRLLQQALPVLDETRTSYLLQGVQSAWDSLGRRKTASSSPPVSRGAVGGASPSALQVPRESPRSADAPPAGSNGAWCPLSEAELDSLLSCIRDLLPDLGDGFLLACLQEYHYDCERVINNILEDTLSPGLDTLDRATPRPVKPALPAVLSTRSNVFDDDHFDVFRRDQVDMSRVSKGRRKQQEEDARQLVDNKQHVSEQRERYHAYQTVVEVQPGDYDDEYDDTYDMNQVGANDLDGDSLLNRRPFTVPRVLEGGSRAHNEEEEEEEDDIMQSKNPDHFVQDPALLRERAEARRAMQQRRGMRPDHLQGRPKGQGQTLETFLDRRKKEANKSRGANHNRRNMADRKRNKGMIPS